MVEIKVQCPKCGYQLTVEGKPDEKIYITCPQCKTDGNFTFPAGKCDPNKIECFAEEGDLRFKKLRVFNGVMGCFHVIQGLLMLYLSKMHLPYLLHIRILSLTQRQKQLDLCRTHYLMFVLDHWSRFFFLFMLLHISCWQQYCINGMLKD
jgi:hypothetical protein